MVDFSVRCKISIMLKLLHHFYVSLFAAVGLTSLCALGPSAIKVKGADKPQFANLFLADVPPGR